MFIRIFRTDSAFQFFLLLFVAGLLWLPGLLHPVPPPPDFTPVPLFDKVLAATGGPSWLNPLLAVVILIIEGIFLTLILSAHDLSHRNNLLPAILYVLFMSWHPAQLTLHSMLIANAFLLFFLHTFLRVYERPAPHKEVFSACVALALACLFNTPVILFFLLVWLGFMIYRIFSWREWIVSLTGFLVPVLYLVTYYFWFDGLARLGSSLQSLGDMLQVIRPDFSVVVWIIIILIGLLVSASILKVYAAIQEKVISIRKKFLFMIWFFFLSIPVFLFSADAPWTQGTASMIPATTLISFYFMQMRKRFWWEILFTLLLLCLAWIRIFP